MDSTNKTSYECHGIATSDFTDFGNGDELRIEIRRTSHPPNWPLPYIILYGGGAKSVLRAVNNALGGKVFERNNISSSTLI